MNRRIPRIDESSYGLLEGEILTLPIWFYHDHEIPRARRAAQKGPPSYTRPAPARQDIPLHGQGRSMACSVPNGATCCGERSVHLGRKPDREPRTKLRTLRFGSGHAFSTAPSNWDKGKRNAQDRSHIGAFSPSTVPGHGFA